MPLVLRLRSCAARCCRRLKAADASSHASTGAVGAIEGFRRGLIVTATAHAHDFEPRARPCEQLVATMSVESATARIGRKSRKKSRVIDVTRISTLPTMAAESTTSRRYFVGGNWKCVSLLARQEALW